MVNIRTVMGALICIFVTSAVCVGANTPTSGQIKTDNLKDLPSGSFFTDLYASHPYLCLVGVAAGAAVILYVCSETFRTQVKQVLNIDTKKSCGCGCSLECGCRTGQQNSCSMQVSKSPENCACCAVRPIGIR